MSNIMLNNLLLKLYNPIKDKIIKRLNEFQFKWKNGNDEDIFAELVFCILTPQSRAAVCWRAVENLVKRGLLFTDDAKKYRMNSLAFVLNIKKANI